MQLKIIFFQFHIGGYQHPNNTSHNIDFQTKKDSIINISFDLLKLMNKIDLSQTFQVMSPSKTAVEISNYWKKIILCRMKKKNLQLILILILFSGFNLKKNQIFYIPKILSKASL